MKIFSFKSKKSTVIFILCGLFLLLATAFTIPGISDRKSTATSDASSNSNSKEENAPSHFELNDAVITRLVLDNLPDNLPLSNVVVHISEDSSVRIDCTLSPAELIDFCTDSGVNIPASLKFMAKLLPENVDAAFCFNLTLDTDTKELRLTPQIISVNGIDLAAELIPDDFSVSINQAVNTLFSHKEKKIQSISVEDGKILINLTDK